MIVTLLDTRTGEKHKTGDDFDAFWWAEGNGSCDCSRSLLMGVDTGTSDLCQRCERFLIVEATQSEYSLRDLNQNYQPELLKAHGIMV